ncbi:hypothetical protein ACWKWN_13465 [Microbacterium trichothecenolyticum]
MNRPKDPIDRTLQVLGLLLLVAVLGLVVTRAFGLEPSITWTADWDVWVVATAVGTVGATLVALWLGARGLRVERDRISRVVSAWVTDEYLPEADGPRYRRRVMLHVANESDEPVFDARVSVLVGEPGIRLGPLSAPGRISVIPPRRVLLFDISTPLRAHRDSWSPRVDLYFSDPVGRRWLRDAAGNLRDVTSESSSWERLESVDERQLGDQETPENPMMVAMAFLAGVQDPNIELKDFAITLAPEASGWAETDWEAVRSDLHDYAPTSMVDYPAPCIARIKLVGDVDLQGQSVAGEGMEVRNLMFLTLTRSSSQGWRIYAIGGQLRPDDIVLPQDAFE